MKVTILDVRGDIGGQYDHSTRPTRLNELFVDSWVMLGRNSDTEIDRGRFRELRPHLFTVTHRQQHSGVSLCHLCLWQAI